MKSFNKHTFVLCPGRKHHKTTRSRLSLCHPELSPVILNRPPVILSEVEVSPYAVLGVVSGIKSVKK